MKVISLDPKIVAMAAGLHLKGDDLVEAIVQHCRRNVAAMLKGVRGLLTIADVERVICEKLNLVIHEIWNDCELAALSRHYAEAGDGKLAALDMELEAADAFGVIYERNSLNRGGELQYVAFVDCRGDKANRRYFTRWHEIAHRLTAYKQFEMPFFRITGPQEPIEQLMDKIAGEIGFLDSLFLPVLEDEVGKGRLTFDVVERIRTRFCFDASFQATLNACAARLEQPVVILEIGLLYKKAEMQLLEQSGDFAKKLVKPTLRVIRAIPNRVARASAFQIHKKRRIPPTSVIYKLHSSDNSTQFAVGEENLKTWLDSTGESLGDFDVLIEARKFQDRIQAIVTLQD